MRDFTKGSVTSHLIAFSVPMLIGNVFQQLYSMTDAAVVGNFVGGDALAAVGTTMPLINLLISVIIGLATGASVLISQYYGAGHEDNLKTTVSTSFIFTLGITLLISVIGIIWAPQFLRLLDVHEKIIGDAVIYTRIIFGGLAFIHVYNIYMAYLRALGDSKNPLYFLIFSTILNIGLDLLFVLVFHMGVAGTAIATVIAQALAAAACLIYTYKRAPLLRIKRLELDWKIFRQILKYSIPPAMQLSLVSLAALTIQRLVNSFGITATAGYTAATRIDSFATMPLANISLAVSTLVAQNIGAGQESRAKSGLKSAMVICLIISAVITAFLLVFGKSLIYAFVTKTDPNIDAILTVGTNYLSIIVLFYWLFGIFFSYNGFFRGVGDAIIVMILTIASLTLRALAAYALVYLFDFGPEAVAWSIPIGWGLCSVFAAFYYKMRLWSGKAAVTGPVQTAQE